MSFLGGLFKKKPGGTFVGNLFRGVASSATACSRSGANKIEFGESKTNKDIGTMSTAERQQYEQEKIGFSVTGPDMNINVGGNLVPPVDIGSPCPHRLLQIKMQPWIKWH